MPWLTQDDTPGLKARRILLPDDPLWLADVAGALLALSKEYNWQQHGDLIAAEMAAVYQDVIAALNWESAMLDIGMIFYTAGESQPVGCLACDGSQILIASYPDLYDEIGDNFGSADTDYFRLPDLRGAFITGAGDAYDLADSGGSNSVTLTENQIPGHTHSVHSHIPGVAVTPGELPVSTPDITGSSTGSTGGGQSHENRPPFLALNPWIVAL